MEPLLRVKMQDNQTSSEEIENLYEEFLQTGDLDFFYRCLKKSCSNDTVANTAVDLIQSKYQDDEDGRPAVILSNRNQSVFLEQRLQYRIWRHQGLSEGKIWKLLAEIYGGEADSIKRQFKRKTSNLTKG